MLTNIIEITKAVFVKNKDTFSDAFKASQRNDTFFVLTYNAL